MSNPFVFDGVALPGDRTAWLAGGLDPDGVVRSFSMEQTGSLIVNGMTTTESLTTSGGLITPATRELNVDGDGLPVDSGYGIWPAATNLVTNGGFETDTTGWTSLANRTLASSDEQAKFGSKSGKATATTTFASGADIATFGITLTAAAHTASFWIYVPSSWTGGAIQGQMTLFTGATGPTTANVNMALTDRWQRVVIGPFTPDPGDLNGALNIRATAAFNSGEFIYIDGVQVETGSIATPYIETDGSTESRTAGRIQMPVADLFSETQGAVFARVLPGINGASLGSGGATVMDWRDNANNRFSFRYTSGSLYLIRRNTDGTSEVFPAKALQHDVATSALAAWDATQIAVSVDGAAFSDVANTHIPVLAATSAELGVGSSANYLHGNILWFATFAGTLTDADAAALNALGDTPPTWAQLVSSVAICAMPTALWRAEDDTFIKASYAPDGGS